MHKKFLALLLGVAFAMLALAAPASAGGNHDDQPSADNKKVQFCHYAGSNENGGSGTYTRPGGANGLPVSAFYNAGHINHTNDIWPEFTYTTVGGDTVTVPAQGDQSLLAFEDCAVPEEDTPVTKPDAVFLDSCGVADDVFSVAPGEGYGVGPAQHIAGVQRITVTLAEGFKWSDDSTDPITFERPEFTNVDCGLPETGGIATYNTTGSIVALAAALAGFALLVVRRRVS